MVITHNLGFPRIGKQRELKFALESYWRGETTQADLIETGRQIQQLNGQLQQHLGYRPVGDFSFYDHVLDTSYLLGNLPARIPEDDAALDRYFLAARGQTSPHSQCQSVHAAEMTKWFDTNYHYLVPELTEQSTFSLHAEQWLEQIRTGKALGHNIKPVIVGPVTYLWLGKSKDASNKLDRLEDVLPVYEQLLAELAAEGIEWVQIDEPVLVVDIDKDWQHALRQTYQRLHQTPVKLLLATYFGELRDNLKLACELPVDGLHIDACRARSEVVSVIDWLPQHKVLSLGVIDGRNIWKTDLNQTLDWLEPLTERLVNRLWLAPSCSLLHVPVDLESETALDEEIRDWLAFAVQKLEELHILAQALNQGRNAVADELARNAQSIQSRRASRRVHQPEIKARLAQFDPAQAERCNPYPVRAQVQKQRFHLPYFPTTTIGSFPQTRAIRQARKQFRQGEIDVHRYHEFLREEIERNVEQQDKIGLDVFVHGEPERTDMVEYFGQQLDGFISTQYGWVQSYGSRCVKPPIIFGDVSRPRPMTVEWATYAQSLTDKPMKGMLTGPVTILNWSFVRDDQPRSETCLQIALAMRDEVHDLEHAQIGMIQIDEAALREGLPLRRSDWAAYLDWAVYSFKVCANGVADETQIHTHMCYSEFNDIISAIIKMDADVITIETSRSDMELLDVFQDVTYPNEIGPGVYDIHSPNIPTVAQIVTLMEKAAERIPFERLWVNPDCGLKTRQWDEVVPALTAMVEASHILRDKFGTA